MSFWMYHTLTKSVYPVPAVDVENVAILADRLKGRIYFEAELTTAPLHEDGYWVLDPGGQWTRFESVNDVPPGLPEGCELYFKQVRAPEVFLTKQGELDV